VKTRVLRRIVVVVGGALGLVVLAPAVAFAHPLGNFTVNTYAGLAVGSDRVTVDYVVDMAEIPTFQARPMIDRNGDDAISTTEAAVFARRRCASLARGLAVSADGERLAVEARPNAASATLPVGQAGLPTLRIECGFEAPVAGAAQHTLAFADHNLTGRVGWHEVTAVANGARIRHSDVPTHSLSARLTSYPSDRLQSPLDVRTARVAYEPGGVAANPTQAPVVHTPAGSVVRGFDELTQSFTASVAARDLTLGLALVALAIGVALGAVHAFAPGHGKTVMAAYLVGERGTVRDGLLIGLTVAATHTAGVLALGGALTASQEFAPEAVYPYLTLASGVSFVVLGGTLLVRALRRSRQARAGVLLSHHHHHGRHHHDHHHVGHEHDHHDHAHHDHDHDDHDHDDHDHDDVAAATGRPSGRTLVALGFAGGLVPTPTAVVVLLGATAIGRAWFGALLVLAYGVGMAATLVAGGLLLARARRRFDLASHGTRVLKVAALIPVVTALVVTGSGLVLVARAATSV
jgi:nickel/cobalt transporter (NicO) family protein